MKYLKRSSPAQLLLTCLKRVLAVCRSGFRSRGGRPDWADWHRMYKSNEHLKARLELVRHTLRQVLDSRPPGRIRLISICAGDGRDILEDVSKHPRRDDIQAWLIDSDAPSVVRGQAAAAKLGLDRSVHFRHADAASGQSYIDIVPADILVVSGFIGRFTFQELEKFVARLPALCASGAAVIWSRHIFGNRGTDISRLRELFHAHQFQEQAFAVASTNGYGVGWQCFIGTPLALERNLVLFDALQLKDQRSGLFLPAQDFPKEQDSPIGRLTFNHGRWSTRYKVPSTGLEIEIHLHEPDAVGSQIAATAEFLQNFAEHSIILRRSTLMGWSYYPQRITAMRNGHLAVRYRSRLRFLPGKTQLIVSPRGAGS